MNWMASLMRRLRPVVVTWLPVEAVRHDFVAVYRLQGLKRIELFVHHIHLVDF